MESILEKIKGSIESVLKEKEIVIDSITYETEGKLASKEKIFLSSGRFELLPCFNVINFRENFQKTTIRTGKQLNLILQQ